MHIQDSGGYTKSGELPAADPVYVTSDRELKQELDSILKKLSPTAEWTVRIQVPNPFPHAGQTCGSCTSTQAHYTMRGFRPNSPCPVQALLRLEGVVLGGAPTFHGFLELFRQLQDPIITQLLDRHESRHILTTVLASSLASRLPQPGYGDC